MSPNLTEDVPVNSSYKFEDLNENVLVTFYAHGAIEQKDIEVLTETDSLDVKTPDGQRWFFNLYNHVSVDLTDIVVKINEDRTQTKIKLRLTKQQKYQLWPQLHSRQSVPITPRDPQISAAPERQTYSLAFKNIPSDFSELFDKAFVEVFIQDVFDCEIQFTETNFTMIFSTKDENFLREHSIPSNMPIRIFVRVKERIKPESCSYEILLTRFKITLIKDSIMPSQWYRLEPSEYTETRSILPSLSIGTDHNFNRSSYSFDRQSDTYSHQPNSTMLHSSNTTPLGYTGIYNPANSCFMNAALQCLSNTRELRDYFLNSNYCAEINRTNPLGMKGIMAEEFASVIRGLWDGRSSYIYANRLREYVGKRHQEFAGNGQHDAQELLTILLDALHEDLNRIINKPLVPPIEDENLTDESLANEYWNAYLKRNDSVIVQLFTGQFKSKTKCPQCQKESTTFDPFTTLSIPVPKRIIVDTIVLYRAEEKAPKKFRINISADGTIADFKRLLSHKADLSITKMLAYKISNRSIDYLKDEDHVPTSLYSWQNSDIIYISEILTSVECNNENIVQLTFYQRVFRCPDFVQSCAYCQASPNPNSTPKWCKKCYRTSYCDEQCQKFHANDHRTMCDFRSSDNNEVIGLPFIITLPESKLNCSNLFEQIKIHAKQSVDIHIDYSRNFQHHIDDNNEFDDENFDDVENLDWTSIKRTLCSSDSWSICRIGDYFIKKKRHQRETNDHNSHDNSFDDYDMLEDIYGNQPLFRLMPQKDDYLNNNQNNCRAIIDFNETSDQILRSYRIFSIDWFTDNKFEAPLRITSSNNRSGINGLVEDASVFNASAADQDLTFDQCLQMFIEPEVLGPDDKWYCPRCKEHIQAEKKMSIWRLPPILIIHLKRFKYNHSSSFGYMSSLREKIDTNVKFPIFNLDMSPYCSSITKTTDDDYSLQSRYDLYGVIDHCGSASFGHYTSDAKLLGFNDPSKIEIGWRTFNDQRVTQLASAKDLLRSDAYVLFYRHRQLSVDFSFTEQLQQSLDDSMASNQMDRS